MQAINSLKLLPKKIFRIGFISIISAFVTSGAVYLVAVLFQVFTVLLGFAEKDQIFPFLQPISESVVLFFSFFTLAAILQGLGLYMQSYINIAFAETFNFEIRKVFLEALFRSNSSWNYDLGTTSNYMAEVIPKSSTYITSIARFITLLIQVMLLGLFCLISMPKEFLISIAIFTTLIPLMLYLNLKSRFYGASILSESKSLNSQLMRSVKNFLFLKILGIEQKEKKQTIQCAKSYYEKYIRSTIFHSMANTVPITFATLVVVFLFYFFRMQGTTTPTLLTLFYLLYRFATTLSQTVAITNGLSMFRPNYDEVLKVLEEEKEAKKLTVTKFESDTVLELKKYSLETENLSFRYMTNSQENFIFQKLKLALPEHHMLVIKGASGSGKTTLLMNLIGVLKYSSGQIRWGGKDINRLNFEAFRAKIGYMGPEPFIITGTVRENLTYGLQEHPDTEESIWEACDIADAGGFLKMMNKGLNTQLTELGEGLSMGQKQRLGLARALLRHPEILILDEVTANLDRKTEESIIQNIAKLKTKMTILISTHSTAFDNIADQILELGEPSTYLIKTEVHAA